MSGINTDNLSTAAGNLVEGQQGSERYRQRSGKDLADVDDLLTRKAVEASANKRKCAIQSVFNTRSYTRHHHTTDGS